jgi:hypothetical protein
VAADEEDGDFAVGEGEGFCEEGAGEHGGDENVCWIGLENVRKKEERSKIPGVK